MEFQFVLPFFVLFVLDTFTNGKKATKNLKFFFHRDIFTLNYFL